jgi:glycosyltransferase involved in cell wall biosynthesis
MKILFVTHRFPYPTVNHAGGVYVFEVIKALKARGVEVDLLSFISHEELQHVEQAKPYFGCMELIPSEKRIVERIIDLPLYFLKPKFIVDAFQRKFCRKLLALQKVHRYDAIQFEWTQMCQYVGYVKSNAVRTLTEHDVSIIPAKRWFREQTNPVKKIVKYLTLKLLEQYEPRLCAKFDGVFTLSKKDADYLQALNGKIKTFEYPLAIKKREAAPLRPPANKHILFLAHLGRIPNVEAVEWFYHEVFVDMLKAYPDAEFIIAGGEPHQRVVQVAKNKNVKLFANVNSLEEFYQAARAFVSPLKIGGGVIKKNLDAMALACPLVTTAVGNEGINAKSGKEVLVANTKEEFMSHLNRILTDDDYWLTIARNALEFIEVNYSFNRKADRMVEVYYQLALNRKNTSSCA